MIILSFILILIGMLLLYKCSSKQLNKVKTAQQQFFIRHTTQLQIIAYSCFLLSGGLLSLEYGGSIGFVSWWIFATPITFLLVLWVNDLKPARK